MFEFDPAKSAANKAKHGIDFEEAKAIWLDENRLEYPVGSETEPRFAMIGMIGEVTWTVIGTVRGENIRLISARRARKEERVLYASAKDNNG